MSSISEITAQQLRQAAGLKDKIETLKKQLHGIIGNASTSALKAASKKAGQPAPKPKQVRRKMSAAARAKIAAAQRARWAKVNASKTAAPKAPKFKPSKE